MEDNNHKKPEERKEVPVEQFGTMTRDDIGILGKNRGKKIKTSEEQQQISQKQPRRDMGDFL